MTDAAVRDLAKRAGVAVQWVDYAGRQQIVSVETLRAVLAALGLPCASGAEIAESQQVLKTPALPSLITATIGEPVDVPMPRVGDAAAVRLHYEDGRIEDLPTAGGARALKVRPSAIGYHRLEVGERCTTLAVAPPRCHTVSDIADGGRIWGLAAQTYGLKSSYDCGIGDMAGVVALARTAAAQAADALALSPVHALFTADPAHFSPYSPSNRLFYNPLHADARSLFGDERFSRALDEAGPESAVADALHARTEIDWPRSARLKVAVFRRLFDEFCSTDLAASLPTALASDFAEFRAERGSLLQDHARFEALHAVRLSEDATARDWTGWPAQWREPHGAAVSNFARQHSREMLFHCFLQWIAGRSLARAQRDAKQAGMRVGLVADLAVGMSGAGSHAWSSQDDVLIGLDIGAPADLFNTHGQNWGLTAFSPRALVSGGFAAFIATLRACMRHAGGLRIDHAMGLTRLWVIPHGANATEGAYLAYPLGDLLRLLALESNRHRAIVVGEDLGTVPAGLRERLAACGVAGMRVLWFERGRNGFVPARTWPADAAALTSTHDLPTVSGWWRGHDIAVRTQVGLTKDRAKERSNRRRDRETLWRAFCRSGVEQGSPPPLAEAPRVTDAAIRFVAETPASFALIPLEDALALDDQPNQPGTIDECPNWRRRYEGEAGALLSRRDVQHRLAPLRRRSGR